MFVTKVVPITGSHAAVNKLSSPPHPPPLTIFRTMNYNRRTHQNFSAVCRNSFLTPLLTHIFMSVAADIMVFWGIFVPCSKCFGGSYCFHLHGYWTLFRLCETTLKHTESGGSTFFRNFGTILSTRCYKRKRTVRVSNFSLIFERSALLIIPKRVCLQQPSFMWLKNWALTSRLILSRLSWVLYETVCWQWALHTAASPKGGMPHKLWTAYQANWSRLHTNSNKPPVLLPHYTERGEFSARLPFISGEKAASPHSLRQEWRTSGTEVARSVYTWSHLMTAGFKKLISSSPFRICPFPNGNVQN
jgi:hypothetical protein